MLIPVRPPRVRTPSPQAQNHKAPPPLFVNGAVPINIDISHTAVIVNGIDRHRHRHYPERPEITFHLTTCFRCNRIARARSAFILNSPFESSTMVLIVIAPPQGISFFFNGFLSPRLRFLTTPSLRKRILLLFPD